MSWTNGFSWLSVFRPARGTRAVRDAADMGTAFGLEASMVGNPGADETPWQAVPAAVAAETWERRVVRRSGL